MLVYRRPPVQRVSRRIAHLFRNQGLKAGYCKSRFEPDKPSIVGLTFLGVEQAKITYDLLAERRPEIRATKLPDPLGPFPNRTAATQKDGDELPRPKRPSTKGVLQLIGLIAGMVLLMKWVVKLEGNQQRFLQTPEERSKNHIHITLQ